MVTRKSTEPGTGKATRPGEEPGLVSLVQAMAISQLLLAGLSVTNYHVQIITRLSSGYPVWYLWLAACFKDKSKVAMARNLVVFITMYSCIQGLLFSCFLPPA